MKNPKYHGPMAVLIIGLLLPVLMLSCGFLTPASVKTVTEQPARTVQVVVTTPKPQPQQVVVSSNFEEDAVLVDLYSRINPAVVNITVFQNQNGVVTPVGQGSGFVYDGDRHIVTNAHVVHGSEQFEVTFSDGAARSATVVGERSE